ncbi:hypothetical protein BOO29_02875 [Vibrio navarrensis]|uniref:Uncharacterized protein n=1 Tax=Vibrio cidicii TaxID=1763883 RepID=A0A151JFG7_9VIBR|nr:MULTISPECIES: hypothetical protein [Vibrio]KGK18109.1 hypothetical protein EA25_09725 [Vibrio navarrensis]KYN24468.1 hypothetical protein AUQ44_00565 [Vibrio cidicii]MBE4580641.1 hypothetical protein [Vibrio navarrensis]MBE4583931.1 hypothetical protein [Vibrio navarrensis]MBE4599904.1 hypothetical protein [Vibrio navarrensis]
MQLQAEQIPLICSALAKIRIEADLTLLPKYTHFAGKPYPLGRCKEIRDLVYQMLLVHLQTKHDEVLQPLREALNNGEKLVPVWGSLRDEYFQNAMVLGEWYIDVSNDTVNPNKPRVEIVRLSEADFHPIRSFEKFIEVAEKYWQVDVYKNTLFPALAPFFPLVCVSKESGASWLAAANDDMIAVAMNSQFSASKQILQQLPTLPQSIAQKWLSHANAELDPLLTDAGDSEQMCIEYQDRSQDLLFRDQAVLAYLKLPKMV